MLLSIGLIIFVIAFFSIKSVNKATAKKQRLLLVIALAAEVIAVITGGIAGNTKTSNLDCSSTPFTQYVSWTLGVVGLVFACLNLYLAVRGKGPRQIIVASLFMIICLVALALAWFLSEFCFTF